MSLQLQCPWIQLYEKIAVSLESMNSAYFLYCPGFFLSSAGQPRALLLSEIINTLLELANAIEGCPSPHDFRSTLRTRSGFVVRQASMLVAPRSVANSLAVSRKVSAKTSGLDGITGVFYSSRVWK